MTFVGRHREELSKSGDVDYRGTFVALMGGAAFLLGESSKCLLPPCFVSKLLRESESQTTSVLLCILPLVFTPTLTYDTKWITLSS